jgi:hypothetical protein
VEHQVYDTGLGFNLHGGEVGFGLAESAQGLADLVGIGQIGRMLGMPIPRDAYSGVLTAGGWSEDTDDRVGLRGGIGVIPKQDELALGSLVSPLAGQLLGSGYAFDPTALQAEVEVGTAQGELSVGDEGFTFGGQTTAVGGALTFGDFGDIDHKGVAEHSEQQLRMGLNAGIGGAARLHWADEDGDGYTEWGFGGDYLIGSMDFKTEDPLRSVLGLGGFADGWMGEGNATYDALNWADKTIMDGGKAVIDGGKAAIDTAYDWWYGPQGLDPVSPPSGPQLMPKEGMW